MLDGVGATELIPLSTRGDEILDRSLQKIGGKGLFIKELEQAMADGDADIAVHSMKDVPAELPTGFCLAAILERANFADALVTPNGESLQDLPQGALVGSSSLRRQAQLKILRPDLRVDALRGNINTRLEKLERGSYDAIILAAAGLERLGLGHHIAQSFSPSEMLPAAAQGVLGLECREDNAELRAILRLLSDEAAIKTTTAERTIARQLSASCQSPVAAYATLDEDTLELAALVAHPDGSRIIQDSVCGDSDDAERIGEDLADRLVAAGARKLLDDIEATYGE